MTTMAPPPAADALDVRTFLLGDHGAAALRDHLSGALAEEDATSALAAFAGPVRGALDAQLSKEVEALLCVDLGQAAMAGWQKHQDLVAAARATRGRAGVSRCVLLADHTTSSTWAPKVEVLVGGAKVATLTLRLEVAFTIVGLTATVVDAHLTRLGGGSGTVTARLAFGGRTVVERTAPFDASVSVPLGAGVPLLGGDGPPDAPSVVPAPQP